MCNIWNKYNKHDTILILIPTQETSPKTNETEEATNSSNRKVEPESYRNTQARAIILKENVFTK